MITLKGSVSGRSFTRTITSDTTEVYVMPDRALYWYGNNIASLYLVTKQSNFGGMTFNTNCIVIAPYISSNGYFFGAIYSSDKYDLSMYNNCYALGETDSSMNTYISTFSNLDGAMVNSIKMTSGEISTLNLSTISGEFYVGFNAGSIAVSTNLYALWLE